MRVAARKNGGDADDLLDDPNEGKKPRVFTYVTPAYIVKRNILTFLKPLNEIWVLYDSTRKTDLTQGYSQDIMH